MGKVKVVTAIDECRSLWERYYPQECLYDLWPVRECFAAQYKRKPFFFIYESKGKVKGILPLCRVEEENCHAFFPGETWQGSTWLEMNKIPAENQAIRDALLNAAPDDIQIRYLHWHQPESSFFDSDSFDLVVDETRYQFLPKKHGFSYERYLESFSGKSRKKIRNDIKAVSAKGVSFRYNDLSDTDHLFRLNKESFGEASYYYDNKFYRSFQSLIHWLHGQNMLRIVTVLIGGDIAAVDIGAIWNKQCSLIAGGTNTAFPGVAKLINLHHIQWACTTKMDSLDFMCGDFGWKERFRLSPSPLYKINIRQQVAAA